MNGKTSPMDGACRWFGLIAGAVAIVAGCQTPSPHTISRNYTKREGIPVDPPRILEPAQDDCAAGGRLFKQYCGSCHNARPLGERPFSNYHVALTHMRDQAYLTGKEYRQLMYFLRRWDNVGPPTPPVEPSPKRLVFAQPIAELRGQAAASSPPAAPPPTGPGPWQGSGTPGAAGGPSRPAPAPGAGAAPAQPSPSPLPSPLD
jgi:hypothetical protein